MSAVFAVTAVSLDPDRPLDGLRLGEHPDPTPPAGWVTIDVRAASLNHHDLWSLRGVGMSADRLPMVLGCDAAGIDPDGNEVIVHSVIASPGWTGDETLDPGRTLLSERHPGTFADRVAVPAHNVVPKPSGLTMAEAACLPTAWLTAYRMLFVHSGLRPGDTVLIQGAGGGVSTALVVLARHAGFRVWITSRSDEKAARAVALGAHEAFPGGARLPERVDAVMETVGAATWSHSMKALRPGGVLVVSGATSGSAPSADLNRLFFLQLKVVGSTMGSRSELAALARFCSTSDVRPVIDRELPLAQAAEGFAAMEAGDIFGKVVLTR